jgi:hypothetical protein
MTMTAMTTMMKMMTTMTMTKLRNRDATQASRFFGAWPESNTGQRVYTDHRALQGGLLPVDRQPVLKHRQNQVDYPRPDVDWSDSLLYHLILNTGRWGIESASRLIANAVSLLQPMAALN